MLTSRRWRDVRLVAGLAFVAVAVVLGWQITKGLANRDMAWAATADLPVGLALTESDLEQVSILLGEATSNYLVDSPAPLGKVLSREVKAGELLPTAALETAELDAVRFVTIGVELEHAPLTLTRGDLIDLWVWPEDDRSYGGAAAEPLAKDETVKLVLANVLVADVADEGTSFGDFAKRRISLSVGFEDSKLIVEAGRLGALDVVLHGGVVKNGFLVEGSGAAGKVATR